MVTKIQKTKSECQSGRQVSCPNVLPALKRLAGLLGRIAAREHISLQEADPDGDALDLEDANEVKLEDDVND